MSCQRGLTLIELLVSLALGVTLSAAMVATYADSRRHQFYALEVARLQENGRHALRLVARDLAMAGFRSGIPGAPLPPAPDVDGPVRVRLDDAPETLPADGFERDWPEPGSCT